MKSAEQFSIVLNSLSIILSIVLIYLAYMGIQTHRNHKVAYMHGKKIGIRTNDEYTIKRQKKMLHTHALCNLVAGGLLLLKVVGDNFYMSLTLDANIRFKILQFAVALFNTVFCTKCFIEARRVNYDGGSVQ